MAYPLGRLTYGKRLAPPQTLISNLSITVRATRVPAYRPSLNLWTRAIFARDPDTGAAKWAYSFTPHDQWDYDGINENVLVDLPIKGQNRKVLVHFDRNAYAYTIDRTTGEVLV